MPKKRFSAQQIVTLLRQIEVSMAQGKATPVACRDAGISLQSFYRWRKEYGGLEIDQAKRMKDLERENVSLKRLVADLSLEKQVLKCVTGTTPRPCLKPPPLAATTALDMITPMSSTASGAKPRCCRVNHP
jgi:putative transposase